MDAQYIRRGGHFPAARISTAEASGDLPLKEDGREILLAKRKQVSERERLCFRASKNNMSKGSNFIRKTFLLLLFNAYCICTDFYDGAFPDILW